MLVIIFWNFLIIQLTTESPQVKRYLISRIRNLVHELSYELPKYLRFRILGNQEILEKCQIWLQTQPNSHCSFHKLNVDNSCQKARKIRDYIFEVLTNFIVSLYFYPNILSRIVDLQIGLQTGKFCKPLLPIFFIFNHKVSTMVEFLISVFVLRRLIFYYI